MKISTIATALTLSLAAAAMAGEAANAEKPRPEADRSVQALSSEDWFKLYDANKDGKIVVEEIRGGLMIFKAYDLNGDQEITLDEVKQAKKPTEPNFRKLDTDDDGFVTRREWQGTQEEFDAVDHDHDGVWSRADRDIAKRRVQAQGMIKNLDKNTDGVISAEEWYADAASFRKLDLNLDGSLDLDELAASRGPARK